MSSLSLLKKNKTRAKNMQQLLLPIGVSSNSSPTSFNFDQGSYSSFAETSLGSGIYRITPIKHWNNQWAWYCLRSGKFAGKTPHFVFAIANHYGISSGEWLACWATSPDTDTWTKFDNISLGATDVEFYHNSSFPSGVIYIALMPMYSFSRVQRKVSEWLSNDLVSDTSSSINGIIGYATQRDAGDGSSRLAPALPYYGFKISSGAGTKNKIVLTSGNHPSENQGRFMLEGCIDWLLGGSVLANYLLEYNDFYCYPCINPQGVWSGYFRSSPETPTQDNNRLWDGSGVNEAVDAFNAAILADTGGTIEVGIDFHGWMDVWKFRGYTSENAEALHANFENWMQTYEPTFSNQLSNTASMLQVVFDSVYNARLHYSIEFGMSSSYGISDWKTAGEYTAKTLLRLTADGSLTESPDAGSRDFNGTTDRLDFDNFYNPTGQPISISAWINSDGIVDTANSDYICCIQDAGDTTFGLVFYTRAAGNVGHFREIGLVVNGSGADMLRLSHYSPSNMVGAWHHVLVTFTGTFNNAENIHHYIDGVECTYDAVNTVNGTGTEAQHTGKFCIGGRTFDDTRNIDGKLAQIAVWDRVLTGTEIANLGSGYAADMIPSGLLFYFKGNTDSLVASPGGTGTADGTTHVSGAGNGPPIIYG